MPALTGRNARFFIMDDLAGERRMLDIIDTTPVGSAIRREVITNNTIPREAISNNVEINVNSAITPEMLMETMRSIEDATWQRPPLRAADWQRMYEGRFSVDHPTFPPPELPRPTLGDRLTYYGDVHWRDIAASTVLARRRTNTVVTDDGGRFQIDRNTGRVIDDTVDQAAEKYRGATADIEEHLTFWRKFDPDHDVDGQQLDVDNLHFRFEDGSEQPPCASERNELVDMYLEGKPDHPQAILRGLAGRVEPDWTRFEYLELLGCKIEDGKTEVTSGLDRADSAFFTVYGKAKDGGNEPILEIKDHPEDHDDAYLTACIKAAQVAKMSFLPLYVLV